VRRPGAQGPAPDTTRAPRHATPDDWRIGLAAGRSDSRLVRPSPAGRPVSSAGRHDSRPVRLTPRPVGPTPRPVRPTPRPVRPTPRPVRPTPRPVRPSPAGPSDSPIRTSDSRGPATDTRTRAAASGLPSRRRRHSGAERGATPDRSPAGRGAPPAHPHVDAAAPAARTEAAPRARRGHSGALREAAPVRRMNRSAWLRPNVVTVRSGRVPETMPRAVNDVTAWLAISRYPRKRELSLPNTMDSYA
jgi:hypothetical protein